MKLVRKRPSRVIVHSTRSQIGASLGESALDTIDLDETHLDRTSDFALRDLDERGLRPFQAFGARWLRKRKRALLSDEQGTGKTAQILRALAGRAAVVVTPASLRLYWRDEAKKWLGRSVRARLAPSSHLPVPSPNEIVIASYDSLPDAGSLRPGALSHAHVVFDEAQFAKGEHAERAIRSRALSRAARRVWCSTGTPLFGTPEDLWWVLDLAGIAIEAFGSRAEFDRVFGGGRSSSHGGYAWSDDPPLPEAIEAALRRVMLRRLRRDVLPELAEKEYETIRCPLDPALIERMQGVSAAWDQIGEGGPPPFELVSAVQAALASSLIPSVVEYASTRAEPLVVMSEHVAPIEAFAGRPGWGTITGSRATRSPREGETRELAGDSGRASVVKAFQSGELDHLAVSSGVGGTGLTLTRSSHLVRVSRSFVPSENEQAEDRLVRIGQGASSVLVTDFVVDHPAEERLLAICVVKRERIRATVDRAATKP